MMRRALLIIFLLVVKMSYAFKIPTHASTANAVLDELAAQIQQGQTQYKIKFHGLDLAVDTKEAYDAIRNNQEYFRMGTLGPDAFPDMVSGQMYLHSNNGLENDRATDVTYESRAKASQYRSVDYGMRLLEKARASGSAQELAFALGYLGHVSGDGFAHAWVNQQAKGAWSYVEGQGIFGPFSEEIKHIATEGLLDKQIPDRLLSTNPRIGGKSDYNRMSMSTPYDMLDGYYREELGGEPVGGMIYKYFSFQKGVMNDIESGTDGTLDFLEGIGGGPGSPAAMGWLLEQIPGVGQIISLTGLNPAEEIAQLFFDDNPLFDPAGWYLNQVRDNMHNLNSSIDVYRRNWLVMSHCTSENSVKAEAVGNADRCVELSGTALTYDGMSGANRELLEMEMEENFALKDGKDHHKLGDNVERAAGYLVSGFRLKELPETLVPADLRLGWANLKAWLLNNNDVIYDIVLYPVATAAAEIVCLADGGVCATDCIVNECSSKIVNCVDDREDWCDEECDDLPPVVREGCYATFYPGCVLGAAGWCAVEGVVGCVGCHGGCVYDFAGCTLENIFDFNSTRKLAEAVDDILAPLDALKAYIVNYLQSRACDMGEALGLPIADVHRVVGIYKTIDQLEKEGKFGFVNFAFLQEDLKDPAWLDKLSQGSNQLRTVLEQIRDGNYRFIGDELSELPIDVPENCFQFNTEGAFYKDSNFGLIVSARALFAEPGPTAARFMADFGGDLPNSFHPFYNTMQLMKLLPVQSAADVDRLFAQQGAESRLLPWKTEGSNKYSLICQDPAKISLICDAIPSLDDPDAYSREAKELNAKEYDLDGKTLTWYWGRSVTPWNEYKPEDQTWKPYVNTSFPLATSDDVVEKLYKKIFRMPNAVPGWMGMDTEKDLWTVAAPSKVTLDRTTYTQGGASMAVEGCGYMTLVSPRAKTTDFGILSNRLSLDVYVPNPQVNPYWQGALTLFVDLTAAGINNLPASQVELTGLVPGGWSKATFVLPDNVVEALKKDLPGLQFKLALNVTCGNSSFRIDNIRFEEPLQARKEFHREGSRGQQIITNGFMGFETLTDWNRGSASVSTYVDRVMQGQAAVGIVSGGWMTVSSRNFSTSELPAVGSKVSVDVLVPDPQPNQWWIGSVSLAFSCPSAGLYNVQVGQADLTKMFWGEYNQLVFALPSQVKAALLQARQDASWTFSLNANHAGRFAFDNFGFLPEETSPVPPTPPAGFACTGACLSATPIQNSATVGTASEKWFVTSQDIHGWIAAEMDGRTVEFNGQALVSGAMPLPAKVDGKYYIRVTAGGKSWASIALW